MDPSDTTELQQLLDMDLDQIEQLTAKINNSPTLSRKENDFIDEEEKKDSSILVEIIDETKEYVEAKEEPKVEFTEPIKPSREKSGSSHSSSSSYSKTLTRSITRRKKVRVNILDADAFNADLASSPKGDGGFFLKI